MANRFRYWKRIPSVVLPATPTAFLPRTKVRARILLNQRLVLKKLCNYRNMDSNLHRRQVLSIPDESTGQHLRGGVIVAHRVFLLHSIMAHRFRLFCASTIIVFSATIFCTFRVLACGGVYFESDPRRSTASFHDFVF